MRLPPGRVLTWRVGVGKTSFIRNLMKVEAAATFETAIGLYLDLLALRPP